jgi:probable rRNA maturation factor
MIDIEIDQSFQDLVDPISLEVVSNQVFSLTDTDPKSEFGLQVTGDDTLQQLNLQYMGIDAPTDVLSFPVSFQNPDSGNPYLGDILISYPTAAHQAEASGHPPEEEVKLLLVHGLLHLLGYDHTTPEEKKAMWALQNSILAALQIQARPTE